MTYASEDAPELVVVGLRHGTHLGGSLARAAERLGVRYAFIDAAEAFVAPPIMRLVTWRLGGHRPPKLHKVCRAVVSACARWRPRWLLTTGMAPIDARSLATVKQLGVQRLNFLTDDPWNPVFSARWFFDSLRQYDHIFSPRRANLEDLERHGCASVTYLPFGYDPELCFCQEPPTGTEWSHFATDMTFVGGGDRDRVPYVDAAIRAGVAVVLYGGYWDRFPETKPYTRGLADVATVRKATRAAKVSLCLVRRANRDGHVMRSLEIPAMGGCMLLEDTEEHRALFGPPGDAAMYFGSLPEMLVQLRWLLSADDERRRLAAAGQRRIREGRHTYDDRLGSMLSAA